MASLMCKLEDPTNNLPTAIDDAYKTMACVEAAYSSSEVGATSCSLFVGNADVNL